MRCVREGEIEQEEVEPEDFADDRFRFIGYRRPWYKRLWNFIVRDSRFRLGGYAYGGEVGTSPTGTQWLLDPESFPAGSYQLGQLVYEAEIERIKADIAEQFAYSPLFLAYPPGLVIQNAPASPSYIDLNRAALAEGYYPVDGFADLDRDDAA